MCIGPTLKWALKGKQRKCVCLPPKDNRFDGWEVLKSKKVRWGVGSRSSRLEILAVDLFV